MQAQSIVLAIQALACSFPGIIQLPELAVVIDVTSVPHLEQQQTAVKFGHHQLAMLKAY